MPIVPPNVLPVAPWQPDLPDYPNQQASRNVRNVFPRTSQSYGPVASPKPMSSALQARCQGAVAYLDSNGNVNLFAGDQTNLYRLTPADAYTWQVVSQTNDGYNTPEDGWWEFAYFNGMIIATNFADNIQVLNLASGVVSGQLVYEAGGNVLLEGGGDLLTESGGPAFADLSSAAPRAKHIAVVKNAFLVAGNTWDPVALNQPQQIWWSAAGDPTNWPTPGGEIAATYQSGAVTLSGDDGAVQAIVPGLASSDAVVFQQFGMKQMTYAGPPDVFNFLPLEGGRGTPAPESPVVVGGICYFVGYDGLYSTDGSAVTPIGNNQVDKTFLADLDLTNANRVVGWSHPSLKIVGWAYPGQGNTNGNPNHLIVYEWSLQLWSIIDVGCETVAQMLGLGYTLDQLYTILGYTFQTLPAPLDSPIWQGGVLQLGLFDLNHKLNFLIGPALAATVDTQEIQPWPGQRTFISAARPLVDGTLGQSVTTPNTGGGDVLLEGNSGGAIALEGGGDLTLEGPGGSTTTIVGGTFPSVAILHRENLRQTPIATNPSAINSLGVCPMRTSGRYVRAEITIPAGGDWTNLAGVELDQVQQGSR